MEYGLRLISLKVEQNPEDLEWSTIVELLGLDCHPDSLRKAANVTCFSGYNVMKHFQEQIKEGIANDDLVRKLNEKERAIKLERVKLQDEKREYNEWLREHARDEAFEEKIEKAIREHLPSPILVKPKNIEPKKRYGLLNFADCHFGKDFKIYGLDDQVINEYSPEIFYERMELLLAETIVIADREQFDSIKVFNLGDALDGFLRHSQIWTLRYGVVDSAIIFGKYIGNWLNTLSQHVCVEYHDTFGNHGECRLLDGRKGGHLNENIEKVVRTCIELINAENPNLKVNYNKTGFIFTNIAGYNILGIHGEVSDLETALKDYSQVYGVQIDYIIAGHTHHTSFKNIGVRKGVISVGSIVGSDDFSIKIRKTADATASFVIFEEGKGKVCEHTIVLN